LAKNTGDHRRPLDPLVALFSIEFKYIPFTITVMVAA
jgi:hypothetical protein